MNRFLTCTVEDIAASTKNALVGGPFGSNLVSADYVSSGIPVIRGQNMGQGRWVEGDFVFVSQQKAEQLSANIARPGDIIFTQRGTLGQVAIVPDYPFERYIVSQSQMKLTPDKSKADTMFLYYYFSSPEQQDYIRQNAIQTGVPHTNLTILRQTIVRLPTLDEQREIAHILGTLDDKIELNRRMNATLEAIARAIFKSWFVDFDPVHAKARGEQPYGMDADTAALFPDAFEDSELGPIPAGWGVEPLDKFIDVISGGTPKTSVSEFWSGDIPWFSVKDMPSDSDVFVIATEKSITQTGLDNSAAKLLPYGTTIISARGTVGKLALVGVPMAMNQSCYGIRGVRNLSNYYIYLLMRSIVTGLQKNTHGTVFDTITRETFSGVRVIVPPENLICAFHTRIEALFVQLHRNLTESRTLAELRDALLPKLISGNLRTSS